MGNAQGPLHEICSVLIATVPVPRGCAKLILCQGGMLDSNIVRMKRFGQWSKIWPAPTARPTQSLVHIFTNHSIFNWRVWLDLFSHAALTASC